MIFKKIAWHEYTTSAHSKVRVYVYGADSFVSYRHPALADIMAINLCKVYDS